MSVLESFHCKLKNAAFQGSTISGHCMTTGFDPCTLLLYLGVTISKHFSCAKHIETVSCCRNSMPTQLHLSLFLSILNYCSSARTPIQHSMHEDKVESVQDFATSHQETVALSLGCSNETPELGLNVYSLLLDTDTLPLLQSCDKWIY